jgi:hypothetical protein
MSTLGSEEWQLNEGWNVWQAKVADNSAGDTESSMPEHTHVFPAGIRYSPEPPQLEQMKGTDIRLRVRVEREDVLELEVLGGYRYGTHICLIYRCKCFVTGHFILRLRHARGVQLWEQDRRFHLGPEDLLRFDQLPAGARLKVGMIHWMKMSDDEISRVLGSRILHNRK